MSNEQKAQSYWSDLNRHRPAYKAGVLANYTTITYIKGDKRGYSPEPSVTSSQQMKNTFVT